MKTRPPTRPTATCNVQHARVPKTRSRRQLSWQWERQLDLDLAVWRARQLILCIMLPKCERMSSSEGGGKGMVRRGGRGWRGKCPYPYPYPSAPPNLPPSKCKATAKAAAAACHCVGQMMCQTDTCRYTRYEIRDTLCENGTQCSARGVRWVGTQTPNTKHH